MDGTRSVLGELTASQVEQIAFGCCDSFTVLKEKLDGTCSVIGEIIGSLVSGGGGGSSFQTGTNAEKLGGSWNVGQVFHVTDGFAVIGFGDDADGFYKVSNDPTVYRKVIDPSLNRSVYYNGTTWFVSNDNGEGIVYSDEDVTFPWEVVSWFNTSDDSPASITLTHPAVQTLAALPASDEENWVNS